MREPGNDKTRSGKSMRALAALAVCAGLLMATLIPMAAGGPLSHVKVGAWDQTVGANANWSVEFTASEAVRPQGNIRVVFPDGFQNADATTRCYKQQPDGATPMDTVMTDGRDITCVLADDDWIAPGEHVTINISSIRNPDEVGQTGTFLVETYDADGTALDSDEGATAMIHPTRSLLAGLSMQPALGTTGQETEWTASFKPARSLGDAAALRVAFPDAFSVASEPAATTTTGGNTSTGGDATAGGNQTTEPENETTCDLLTDGAPRSLDATVNGSIVTCSFEGAPGPPANASVRLTVPGVTNPSTAGGYGPLSVDVIHANGSAVESGRVFVTIGPHAFTMGPTYTTTNTTALMMAEHRINFTTFNDWAHNGSLRIQFPAGFFVDYPGNNVSVETPESGLVRLGPANATGTTIVAPRNQTFTTQATPGGTNVSIVVQGVRNPAVNLPPSPIVVQTLAGDGAAHDEGRVASIQIHGAILGGNITHDLLPTGGNDTTGGNNTGNGTPPAGGPQDQDEDTGNGTAGREAPGAGLMIAVTATVLGVAFAARTRRP